MEPPKSCRSPPARRMLPILSGCWPTGDRQTVPFRPFRHGRDATRLRRYDGSSLLHQDRLEDRANLYRPARTKDLTRELLNVEISKQQQSSDWGAATLSEAQLAYAASDVLHLHALREKLDAMLKREDRDDLRERPSPICLIACGPTSRASRPWTFSRTAILRRRRDGAGRAPRNLRRLPRPPLSAWRRAV